MDGLGAKECIGEIFVFRVVFKHGVYSKYLPQFSLDCGHAIFDESSHIAFE